MLIPNYLSQQPASFLQDSKQAGTTDAGTPTAFGLFLLANLYDPGLVAPVSLGEINV